MAPQPKAKAWIFNHLHWSGGGCLIWPFSRDSRGYSERVSIDGKMVKANIFMCELAHGPAPTPEHEVAHSCHNGSGGCIHPEHLHWATPAENIAESVEFRRSTGRPHKSDRLYRIKVRRVAVGTEPITEPNRYFTKLKTNADKGCIYACKPRSKHFAKHPEQYVSNKDGTWTRLPSGVRKKNKPQIATGSSPATLNDLPYTTIAETETRLPCTSESEAQL